MTVAPPAPDLGTTRALSLHQLDRLVRAFANAEQRWGSLVRFGAEGERWWTRLHADDSVDIWLLTWRGGHRTDLHPRPLGMAGLLRSPGRHPLLLTYPRRTAGRRGMAPAHRRARGPMHRRPGAPA